MIHPIPGADGSYLRRRAHEVSTVPEIHFNDSSDYLFVLPMSHGRLRLRRGAETVHDGPVQPGMLRIVVPGERSAMAVQSTFESVMLTVPSATVRRAADELGARVPVPGTSAWSSVRPPHTDLYLLGKSMVGALTATDRRRTMLVEGLSVALLALVLDQGPTGPVAAPVRQLDDTQWSAAVELGPWVNPRWLNIVSSVIITVLLMLSGVLVATTLFPSVNTTQVTLWLSGVLIVGLIAAGIGLRIARARRGRPAVPSAAVSRDERMRWRMPPLALLKPVQWSPGIKLGMSMLRGYLVIAALLLIVKAIQLSTG